MKQIKAKLAIMCILLSFCARGEQSFADDPLKLGLHLKPGDKHIVQIISEDRISQTVENQQIDMNHSKIVELGLDINEVDAEGCALIAVGFRAIKEKTIHSGGSFDYDSANPQTMKDNPLAPTYNAMIGESFVIKVGPSGEVVKVNAEGIRDRIAERIVQAEDEFIKQSAKDNKNCNTGEERTEQQAEAAAETAIENANARYGSRTKRIEAMKDQVKTFPLTTEEKLKELAESIMVHYPVQPVRAGDSWVGKIKVPLLTSIETEATYTLKELKEKVAVIEVNSKKALMDETASVGTEPSKVTYTGEIEVDGTLEVNEDNGFLAGKQVKTLFSGLAKTREKTIPMSIVSTVTIKTVE